MAAEEAKLFGALLNGVAKRVVFADADFTDELLKKEIYPALDDAGEKRARVGARAARARIERAATIPEDFRIEKQREISENSRRMERREEEERARESERKGERTRERKGGKGTKRIRSRFGLRLSVFGLNEIQAN